MGAELLKNFPALHNLIPIVRHHHERFDGRGYPDGLQGEQIPFEARVVSVADAVEAMASDRPYRQACTLAEIKAEIEKHAGTQFDPQIVKVFLEIIELEAENLIVNSAHSWIPGREENDVVYPLE
jgi:HD-GYP domain-containing protein (c-di-GMP phosphodiesterase class II)